MFRFTISLFPIVSPFVLFIMMIKKIEQLLQMSNQHQICMLLVKNLRVWIKEAKLD